MLTLIDDIVWQWDTDRVVSLPNIEADTAQFAFEDDSSAYVVAIRKGDNGAYADIPNELLQRAGILRCWVARGDHTVDTGCFSVRRRPKPDDYIYTETEIKRIDTLETWVREEIAAIPSAATYLNNSDFINLTSQ